MKKTTLLFLFAILPFFGFSQNLAPNPTLDGDSNWSDLNAGTTQMYDATLTRTADGSGSWIINSNGSYNSGIKSSNISQESLVTGDYSFKYYVYGTAGDKTKPVVRDNGASSNINGDTYTILVSNTWELVEQTFAVSGTGTVNIRAMVNSDDSNMSFSVDDISFTYIEPEGITLEKNIVGLGEVALTLDKTIYDETDVETLTATAATHWMFSGWSGDLSGPTNPETLLMNEDKSVTAIFIVDPSFDYSFGFDTDGNLENWSLDPQVSVASHTGGLVTLSIVEDQWSRFNLFDFPIPTSSYNKVTIVVKNEEATTNQLGIAVGVNNETEVFPLLSQPSFQTFEIDLTKFEDWTGDVESFRIRFADENNTEKSGRPSTSGVIVIDSVVFSYDALLSTSKVDSLSLSVYPNPVKDILNISIEVDQVEIYNILGQKIVSLTDVSSVDTSNLKNGSYIVKFISSDGLTATKRFFKE